MRSIRDALETIEGKWKLLILFSLVSGPKRFRELSQDVGGIGDRALSKELKALEANLLLTRNVRPGFPQQFEYAITEHGRTLEPVMESLHLWGLAHRGKIFGTQAPQSHAAATATP